MMKTEKRASKVHIGSTTDFCSVVEGVTFGIRGGHTFALMSPEWKIEDRIAWAKANAQYFEGIVSRLINWGKATAIENGVEY